VDREDVDWDVARVDCHHLDQSFLVWLCDSIDDQGNVPHEDVSMIRSSYRLSGIGDEDGLGEFGISFFFL
jgi:hypothetical protein